MLPVEDARLAKLASPAVAGGDTISSRAQANSDAFVMSARNLAVTLSPAQISVAVPVGVPFLLTQWDLAPQPVTGDGTIAANVVSNEIRDGVFTVEDDFRVSNNDFLLDFLDQGAGTALWGLVVAGGFDLGEPGEFIFATFVAEVDGGPSVNRYVAIIMQLSDQGVKNNPPVEFAAFIEHDGGAVRNMLQVQGDGAIQSRGPVPT